MGAVLIRELIPNSQFKPQPFDRTASGTWAMRVSGSAPVRAAHPPMSAPRVRAKWTHPGGRLLHRFSPTATQPEALRRCRPHVLRVSSRLSVLRVRAQVPERPSSVLLRA